uniref:Uncharacterized protein n=1 Tax=Oryza meridionalis TaxID=40149 RepID=A0A0E0DEV3_9ORYZ
MAWNCGGRTRGAAAAGGIGVQRGRRLGRRRLAWEDEGNGGSGGPRCCSSSSPSRLLVRSPTARESLDHISVNCTREVGATSGCRSVHSRRSAPTRRARLLVPAQPRLCLDSPDWRQSATGREWERERDDSDDRRGSWLASGSWGSQAMMPPPSEFDARNGVPAPGQAEQEAIELVRALTACADGYFIFSEVERVSCERIASFLTCADSLSAGNHEAANYYLARLGEMASPAGPTPMHSVAAYFTEAPALRIVRMWPHMFDWTRAPPSSSLASTRAAASTPGGGMRGSRVRYIRYYDAAFDAVDTAG